jgi:hypothetical protein
MPQAMPLMSQTEGFTVSTDEHDDDSNHPLLEDVHPEKKFITYDGQALSNLKKLREALNSMDDAVFYHHVRPHANDFATWIYEVVGDIELAETLGPVKDRELLYQIIDSRVKELENTSNFHS